MNTRNVASILVLALTVGGCATILGGTSQTITVNSNVNGAQVHFNELLLGTTPLTTSLKRGQEGVIRVSAPGHQPFQIAVNKKISTLFWVNIFTGGVFGSSTDYSTGAMYEYEPSTFMASLQPSDLSPEQAQEWQRREGLRGFVLLNNEALVTDLAAGHGQFIDVLVETIQVQPADRAAAIERWRSIYDRSTTVLDFAQAMLAELDS